jgi:hypothetical protein
VGEVGDERLAIAWIASNQIVIHGALSAHISDSSGLMNIKMGWGAMDGIAQSAAILRIRFRRFELEVRAWGCRRVNPMPG